MGLMQKAYETYENHKHLVGVPIEGKSTLIPVSHISQKAQIEITIDAEGNFISAKAVPKDDAQTIIPVSEGSGSRSGRTPEAHPLCDQLKYIASYNTELHDDYLNKLTAWYSSEYSHPKVSAVYKYVLSDTILADLERAQIIKLKPDGTLDDGSIAATKYEKCTVRWCVIGAGDKICCWEDKSLMDAYIAYYHPRGQSNVCMISGENTVMSTIHPKGTVARQNLAKLISANDSEGMTYRGRFTELSQALTVGFEASQKAHLALRWVIENQGFSAGSRTIVCWNPEGNKVHSIADNLFDEENDIVEPSDYRALLAKTICGYRNELPAHSDVVIASFDAATQGRLSVTYYNELKASDYYDRIENWYDTCCWQNKNEGIMSPMLVDIAVCAFGSERSKFIELDEKVKSEQVQRLFSCVMDKAHIPYYLVDALVQRASMPMVYNKRYNYEKVLFTACALIRKYYNDKAGMEEWKLKLDPNKNDLSYQFGRLLAVADKIERDYYYIHKDKTRATNAMRLQSAFCQRPFHTFRILDESMKKGYLPRLGPSKRIAYKCIVADVMEKISDFPEEEWNRPLKDTYLMGYYLQLNELYKSNKQNDMEENKNGSIEE